MLDTNRSRNIEIFLPSFSLSLDSLESTLAEQLNRVKGSDLGIDHVVALKRLVSQHSTPELSGMSVVIFTVSVILQIPAN